MVYIPELARVVVEAGRSGIDGERYLVADAYLSTSDMAYALHAVGLACVCASCFALQRLLYCLFRTRENLHLIRRELDVQGRLRLP